MTTEWRVVQRLVDPKEVNTRIVRNPNYCSRKSDVPGCCITPLVVRSMKPKFFKALEKSIRQEGFRNPIILVADSHGLHLQFGGSRLRVAKQLDEMIPALIVDWTGKIAGCPVTPDNWPMFFEDVPKHFVWEATGLDTHYSLERARRQEYDPAGFSWVQAQDAFIAEEFPWLGKEE